MALRLILCPPGILQHCSHEPYSLQQWRARVYVCPLLTSVLEGHCECTTSQRALELEGDTLTISLFLLDCSSYLYLVPCTHQHCTVVCCAQSVIVSRSAKQTVLCLKWGLLVLQRVRSCITTVGMHDAASTCNLHKGMPLNYHPYPQFNGMPLYKLTCACCIVHANSGDAASDPL